MQPARACRSPDTGVRSGAASLAASAGRISMKHIIIAVALMAAVPAIAQAETFTFKSQSKDGTRVQVPPTTAGGRPSGGGTFSVSTEATDAAGKKQTAK